MAMDFDLFKQVSRRLMESAEAVFLATSSEGFPEIRALFNLRNRMKFPTLTGFFARRADNLDVYLFTNTSSKKVAQLRQNPCSSLYFCDPGAVHGLLLSGKMETVGDRAVKEELWVEGWERYYPGGVQDPDYTVLRLKPERARGWHAGAPFQFDLE
jgi:general stress protein 26